MSAPVFSGGMINVLISTTADIYLDTSVIFTTNEPTTYQWLRDGVVMADTPASAGDPIGMHWNSNLGTMGGRPTSMRAPAGNTYLYLTEYNKWTGFQIRATSASGTAISNVFTVEYNPNPPTQISDCPPLYYSDSTSNSHSYNQHFSGAVTYRLGILELPTPHAGVSFATSTGTLGGLPSAYTTQADQFQQVIVAISSSGGFVVSNLFSYERWKTPVAPIIGDRTFTKNDYISILLNPDVLWSSSTVWSGDASLPRDMAIIYKPTFKRYYLEGYANETGVHSGIVIMGRNPLGQVFSVSTTFTVIGDPILNTPLNDRTNKEGDTGLLAAYGIIHGFQYATDYAVVSGTPPPNMVLHPTQGIFQGTIAAGSIGTYPDIVVSGSNTYGSETATVFAEPFTWYIVAGPKLLKPFSNIVSDSNEVISIELTDYFGAADTYSHIGTLPDGISLNTSTGLISGTITEKNADETKTGIVFSGTNVTNTTDGETITWKVRQLPPVIHTPPVDQYTIAGTSVNLDFGNGIFTGGQHYEAVYGDLPNGLSMDYDTGFVTGTTDDETWKYSGIRFRVLNTKAVVETDPINWFVGPPPDLKFGDLIIYMSAGTPVSVSLHDYFGNNPATFESIGNPLPNGLSLDASTGLITGTPSSTSPTVDTGVRFKATNPFGELEGLNMTWYLVAPPTKLTDIPSQTSSPSSVVSYNAGVHFTGATSYAKASGIFPVGLNINFTTGVISGTTTSTSLTYPNIVISATNSDGTVTSAPFNWTIGQAPELTGVDIPPQESLPGQIVSFNVSQFFKNKPTNYSVVSSSLPSGVSLDAETGVISGNIADDLFTTYGGISIRGLNSLGAAISNTFNWIINGDKKPELTINFGSLESTSGETVILDASDYFSNNPTNFEFVSAAPSGLVITSEGLISGELDDIVDYEYSVRIRATNKAGHADSNIFSWFIFGNLTDEQKFYRDWLADESAHRVLLVEANYTSAEVGSINLSSDEVFGKMHIETDEVFGSDHFSGVAEGIERMSTAGFITYPTDSISNTEYEDVVLAFPNFRRSMSEALEKKSTQSFGDIIITNVNGERDHWLDRSWNGRQVVLKLGDPSWTYDQFQTIMVGTSLEMTTKGRDKLVLKLGDKGLELERKIEPQYITEGSSQDKMIPLVYGKVTNLSPPLSSGTTGNATYAISYKPIDNIVSVYDNGAKLSEGGNWSTNVEGNSFTMTASSVGKITCDIQGGVATVGIGGGGGSYIDDIASIIHEIVISNSSLTIEDINTVSFQNFRTQYPQKIGIAITSVVTVSSILDKLVSSIGGWWGFGRDGRLVLGVLTDPEFLQPRLTITPDDIVQGGISMKKRYLPIKQVTLGYNKNETVMAEGDLAGVVSDSDRKAELGIQWKEVRSINELTGNTHLLSTETGLLETALTEVEEATEESLRRLKLREKVRSVYQIDAFATPFSIELGDVINVVHPRFGFENGEKCVVVGYSESITPPRIKLDVWK